MIKRSFFRLLLTMSLAANAIVIGTLIMTMLSGNDFISATYLLKSVVAIVIIVGVGMMFGTFYSQDRNPFIVGSVHFIITLFTLLLAGLWAHWFPFNWGIILTALLIFVALFIIIWLLNYFYWKNQINKMNGKLSL